MKKLVYILSAGGLLIAASCNEPAKFDQAACERRADSIAVARVNTEMPTLSADASEMCAQQLSVLSSTRDSLDMILNTASASKGSYKGGKSSGGKTSGGTTTTTTPPKGGLSGGSEDKGGLKGNKDNSGTQGGGMKGNRNNQ